MRAVRDNRHDGSAHLPGHLYEAGARQDDDLVAALRGADAVVNLAGVAIGGRPWTPERKRAILQSRLDATGAIVEAIRRLPAEERPNVLVNASGIDVYGDRPDGEVTEESPPGESFLAGVVVAWEEAARAAEALGVRVVLARNALIVAPEAPAWRLILLPFRLFVGGPLGSGRQRFTWVHIDDAVGLYDLAVRNPSIRGPVNVVAPEVPTQRELGRAIAKDVRAHGGLLADADFEHVQPRESPALAVQYRGLDVRTLPGASGAITVVEMLRILDGFELNRSAALSAPALHLLAEAQRRAFADRFTYLADPAVVGEAIYDRLASAEHAAEARSSIDPKRATPSAAATPVPPSSDCTTHVNVVDREGRMVALTSTLGGAFGSGVVAAGTGIMLANVMTWFDPRPGHPNSIAGGKRILSAIAPMLLLRGGDPFLCTGAPGGRRIMSAMLHVLTNVVDWGLAPQEAVNSPRTHCESADLLVDTRIPVATRDALTAMGHHVVPRLETFASTHFARPSAILVRGAERRAGVGALKNSTAIGVD